MTASFPHQATLRPTPFKVDIPDATLEEMKLLIKASKIAPLTYESSQTDGRHGRFGVSREWMIQAKSYWLNVFDWRKIEAHINTFSNYMVPVIDDDGHTYQMHFVAMLSEKTEAVPLVLLHGWPGSFFEFLSLLDILRKKYQPSDLPYHVLVPSLPGYTFSSSPPLDKDFDLEDITRLINKLVVGLGFGNGYVVQGGDIGSTVGRILGAKYPSCKAVHLNLTFASEPEGSSQEYEDWEKDGLARGAKFNTSGLAYALEHETRPSTIGHVLATNPVALLAWIGEKYLEWTDEDPALDTILTSITLYWLTETFPRCIYPYRQLGLGRARTILHIAKPFGFSAFPKEFMSFPKEWIANTGNLVFYKRHAKGGHFAALERPNELLADVEAFIAQVWDEAKTT